MMQRINAWKDSRGVAHSSLDEAKQSEIIISLESDAGNTISETEMAVARSIAKHIVTHSEKFVDILTTTENSRAKARKVNGGRKARKPKESAPTPTPAPAAETPPAAAAA